MRTLTGSLVILVAAFGVFCFARAYAYGSVEASRDTTAGWREALVTVETALHPIEGADDRAVGTMRQRGFAFFENGEVSSMEAWLTFERSSGVTRYQGYAVYRFEDDSTKLARFTGDGDPRGAQSGEFELKRGTGRFEGITGAGAFTGQGFPPHGDIYLDVTGAIVLP